MTIFRALCLVLLTIRIAADHETVGAYAVDMKTGRVLVDENGDKSMVPGSCIKLVVTGAALHLLDPSGRFETDLEYDGEIREGTLYGNLYIKGGGDPCLGRQWREQINAWVAAISQLGIRKIQGKIIGDDSRWEPPVANPSWAVEDVGNYYGAVASALSFHENSYSLFFRPGKVGDDATIVRTDPPFTPLIFKNAVKTAAAGSGDRACIYEAGIIRHVRGTIPAGVDEFSIKGSIPDPSGFCAELLSQALQGIVIERREISSANKRVCFHTTFSPPIKEIVYWSNQKSNNLYAEHLLKKIGEGSTAAGIEVVRSFWHDINLDGFNMVDGCGLSRKNLITPKQLVSVLLKMKDSSLFFDSLPALNEKTRAKSGSMSHIKCYAGYTGDVAFAIMVNQYTDRQKANEKIKLFLSKLTY